MVNTLPPSVSPQRRTRKSEIFHHLVVAFGNTKTLREGETKRKKSTTKHQLHHCLLLFIVQARQVFYRSYMNKKHLCLRFFASSCQNKTSKPNLLRFHVIRPRRRPSCPPYLRSRYKNLKVKYLMQDLRVKPFAAKRFRP